MGPLVKTADSPRKKARGPRRRGPDVTTGRDYLVENDEVFGGEFAPLAGYEFVLHLLAFVEALDSSALNGRNAHERVAGSVARLDKAEAFGRVEPFYSSGRQS